MAFGVAIRESANIPAARISSLADFSNELLIGKTAASPLLINSSMAWSRTAIRGSFVAATSEATAIDFKFNLVPQGSLTFAAPVFLIL